MQVRLEPTRVKHLSGTNSTIGSSPYPETLDKAEMAHQGQTLAYYEQITVKNVFLILLHGKACTC